MFFGYEMGCLKGDIAGQHAFCPIPNLCKSVSSGIKYAFLGC